MANRLPIPGQDKGTWGDILNDFLEVSHNSDGTLIAGSVGATQLQSDAISTTHITDGTVTEAKLEAPVQTIINSVASKYVKPVGGIPLTDLTTGVQTSINNAASAIISVDGVAGVAGNVTLGLDHLSDTLGVAGASDAQVLSYSFADGAWIPATPTTTTVSDATTNAKGIVELAGDLGGTAAAPKVAKINGVAVPSSAPTNGQILTATSTATSSWSTPNIVAPDATTSSKGIVELSGDLGGTAAAPVVAKLNGVTAPASGPTNGQVLTATGTTTTAWSTPSTTSAPDATSSTKGILELTGDLAGTATAPVVAKLNGITAPASGPTNGQVLTATGTTTTAWSTPAGVADASNSTKGILELTGDFGGTATAPTVAKINGVAVPSSAPTNGQVLTATGTSTSAWSTPSGGGSVSDATTSSKGIVELSGDLGGTAASPAVLGINGITAPSTPPTTGQVLTATSTSTAAWSTPASVASNGAMPGYIYLDSYSLGSDDANLTQAMSDASAATYHPTIRLGNKSYTFSTARNLYDGFRLEGPPGYSNAEKSAANMGCLVHITTSGVWLTTSTSSYSWDLYIGQIAFTGTSSTQFLGVGSGGSGLYCAMIRDVSFSGFKTILGSQATSLPITACQFDGFWETNNSYNGAFHLGGSDNTLWPDGMLLDSGTAYNTAGNAQGQFHLWCDYLEKTFIGPLYITCEGNWGGIHVTGPGYNAGSSNAGGPLTLHGVRCEGRNPGAGSNGDNIRVDGGILILRDCWVSYGMVSPSSTTRSPVDAGIIMINSGMLHMDSCTYDHATGIAETVPYVYNNGGNVRIFNQMVGSRGGVWSGLPGVHTASGTSVNDSTTTTI